MSTAAEPGGFSGGAVPYPSLVSLKDAHTQLLRRHRQDGASEGVLLEIQAFIRQGAATGSLLDAESDRHIAQSLLDYWVTTLYRAQVTPPEAILEDYDPALAPSLDESACPYRGLSAFLEEHQDRFFGRSRLIDSMLGQLASLSFLAVLGPSGSGKSSLVLGGLVPRLKQGALPASETWTYFPSLMPSSDPLRALAMATKPADVASADWCTAQVAGFRADTAHLATLVAGLTPTAAMVVVDQFEETFTLCADDDVRAAFVGNLLGLVSDPGRGHRVVVTMRTDFESQLVRLPELEKAFQAGQVRVTPLTSGELRQAIEEPAKRVGLRFEDGVVDELIRDILGEPAGLPLLQFTLLRLWKSREGNRVTLKAYRTLGGARRALALSADEFMAQLIFQDRETARRILLRMARPSEGLEVTSNRVLRSTIYKAGEATDQVDRVLDKLVGAGLVRLTPGETRGEDQAEVAHEALIRNWPQLVGWLEDERVQLRQRLRFTSGATQWLATGKDPGALLRGAALDEASGFTDLNELEGEYLEASRNALEAARLEKDRQAQALVDAAKRESEAAKREGEAARKHARQLRAAAAVLLILLAGVAFAAYLISTQNTQIIKQVRTARSRELASHSIRQLDTDPQLSLLLALEAASESPTGEAAAALRQAVSVVRDMKIFTGHEGRVWRASFTPDGKGVLSGGSDNTLRLWELDGSTLPVVLEGHTAKVHDLVISVDGRYAASEAADGTARLWDLRARTSRTLEGLNGLFAAIDFSRDGQWLVTECSPESTGAGVAAIWNVETGQKAFELRGHTGQITALKFSPNGQFVVSSSEDKTIRVWSGPQFRQVVILRAHTDVVNDLAFSPDGRHLVSAGDDGQAVLWNTASWKMAAPLHMGQGAVGTAAFSPDGRHVITAFRRRVARSSMETRNAPIPTTETRRVLVPTDPGDLKTASPRDGSGAAIWETASGERLVDLLGHEGDVYAASIDPHGKLAVTAGADGTARLWDVSTGSAVGVLRGHTGQVYSAEFNHTGDRVVTAGEDGTVRIWNASSRQVVDDVASGSESATRVAFVEGGAAIAVANLRGVISRWGLSSTNSPVRLALRGEWKREDLDPLDVAFSADGTHAITGSKYTRTPASLTGRNANEVDKSARVWNMATGALVAELSGHESPVQHVALSGDNRFAGTVVTIEPDRKSSQNQSPSPSVVRVWTIGNETPRVLQHAQPVNSIEFSGDSILTTSDDGAVRIWGVEDGKLRRELKSDGPVFHAITSPDGKTVLTSSLDGSGALWSIEAVDAPQFLLKGHRGPISRGAFSADGRLALTASEDGTIRAWETASGEFVAELRGAANQPMTSAAFSPDGLWVVGGAADGRVRLISCEPCLPMEELLALGRARTTRQLTAQERHQYLHDEATSHPERR